MKPKATTCKVCGAPRWERAGGMALCELHMREYWASTKRRNAEKRKAHGEPASPPRPRRSRPARPAPEPEVEAAPAERITVTFISGRISMDAETFARLIAGQGQAPSKEEAATAVRLAVVSRDLTCARIYDATHVREEELHDDSYVRQIEALRSLGYTVCVEG